jgi:hypothetical protein
MRKLIEKWRIFIAFRKYSPYQEELPNRARKCDLHFQSQHFWLLSCPGCDQGATNGIPSGQQQLEGEFMVIRLQELI